MPNCLPRWLYHFVFPSAMNENSCSSTCSLAIGVVNILDCCHPTRSVVVSIVLICNSIMTYFVVHFLICLFANYVSSLVRWLQIFSNFSIKFFIFLLLSLKSFWIFWVTILYQRCPLQILFPSWWSVFSFSWYSLCKTSILF